MIASLKVGHIGLEVNLGHCHIVTLLMQFFGS